MILSHCLFKLGEKINSQKTKATEKVAFI